MATVEASLEVGLTRVASDHPATQAAAADLWADLGSAQELRVRERHAADPGTKGAAVDIVVALGTSGSIGAFVKIIQLWLSRDRRRSLTVSVVRGAEETVIKVDGDPVSIDTLADALDSVVRLSGNSKSS
jgi:Effector Associated Constant Component 1